MKKKINRRSAAKLGTLNPNATLTAAKVRTIRRLVAKHGHKRCYKAELAKSYGIGQGCLADVVSGRRWGHVKGAR